MKKIYDIAVVGAGAAGLFFAATAPEKRNAVLIDQSEKPGKKLLMTGGGACNITHSGSIKDFVDCYFDKGKKIRGCLNRHNNIELMEFFQKGGLKLTKREDGKVFPASMNAEDVRRFLVKKAEEKGFQSEFGTKVTGLDFENDGVCILHTKKKGKTDIIRAVNLVIATGGCSYPTTGSDGSMFSVIKNIPGIKVTELVPSLAPIYIINFPYTKLQGVSLQEVSGEILRDGKLVAREKGDLLFAGDCFSGPLIMNLSRFAKEGDTLSLNYLPDKDKGLFRKEFNQDFTKSKKSLGNFIAEKTKLPKSFSELISKRAEGKSSEAAKIITMDRFIVKQSAGFNRAMTTAGGIDLTCVDRKTFKLKTESNEKIYAIGEVLDIDGKTGGYNLQFAYSSARAAADAIYL